MTDEFNLIDSLLESKEPDWETIGVRTPRSGREQYTDMRQASGNSLLEPHQLSRTGYQTVRQPSKTSSLVEATTSLTATPGEATEESKVTTHEVMDRIKYLLNLGVRPDRIASYVSKLAELKVFDQKTTAEFLKDQSGQLGIAYMEPNFYMNSCVESLDKVKKEGHLQAFAVKRIAKCASCQNCQNQKLCSLYAKPIVGSTDELNRVVTAELSQRVGHVKSKRAALVTLHNGGQLVQKAGNDLHRSTLPVAVRTAGDKPVKQHKEASVAEVKTALLAGIPLRTVYANLAKQYGKQASDGVLKRYVAGLKQSKDRVVLAALDCSFLANKLAPSNGIIGESKCASCQYRHAMTCGKTGGTLLTFPGMNKASADQSHRIIHEGALQDGAQMLKDWEIARSQPEVLPIEINPESRTMGDSQIELNSTSKVDL